MKKYQVIYADPAWQYDQKGRGSADKHYPTMSVEDMKAMPIADLADDNAVLIMWYTGSFMQEAIDLANAWGFKLKTGKFFTWMKLYPKYDDIILSEMTKENTLKVTADMIAKASFMGNGFHTRANTEDCLLAVRGKGVKRERADIRQLIISPVGKHSAKPIEAKTRIEQLYGNQNRLELFSRDSSNDNWDHWGNECENSIEISTPSELDDLL